MMGKKRLKISIFSLIAVAVMLMTAVISVSYAKWEGRSSEAKSKGSVGDFYVEYPADKSSGETPDASTYYVVSERGGILYYYPMTMSYDNGRIQYGLSDLFLASGDNVSFYKGSDKIAETIADDRSEEWCGTVSDNSFTAKNDALYSFYLKLNNSTGAHTNLTLHTDNSYYNRLDIEYGGGTIRLAVSEWSINAYVWRGTQYFDGNGFSAVNNWPGVAVQGSGNGTAENNLTHFDFTGVAADTSAQKLSVIFNMTGYQTDTIIFGSFAEGLADGAIHYLNFKQGTATAPGSTTNKILTVTEFVYAEPAHITVSGASGSDSSDKVVRQVNATMAQTDGGAEYTYHNYICVSRQTGDDIKDNSIAFLEFSLQALNGTDLASVNVTSVTLTRRNTDSSGVITGGFIDPAPRLYNNETVRTLADIDHGEMREPTNEDDHMVRHFEKGIYCILFFAGGSNQYYALDVEIKTTSPAEFTLTATASNMNHWQRFESGYGAAWGFYLGGLINNVWLWDPRRTTKLEGTEISGPSDPQLATTRVVTDDGTVYDNVYYPKKIDLTLTVNLTEGSLVKLYMVDSSGHRLNGVSAYILPKKIVAPDELYGANDSVYNNDATVENPSYLNLRMPVSGEYTFRFVGNVAVKTSTDFINVETGKYSSESQTGENWYGISYFNFLVDTLYISTASTAKKHTVTFDPNGGSWSDGTTEQSQQVVNGGKAVRPDDPTNGDEPFMGWYTERDGGELFDFSTPITAATTLYAHYGTTATYTVTFDVNGGAGENTVVFDLSSGDTVIAPSVDPTKDLHSFDGWYTEREGGTKATFPLIADGNATYYAHWTANKVRIVLDAAEWPGDADTDVYHIYARRSAAELTGTWATRAELTSMGDGKYAVELSDAPTEIIFTRDAAGSRTEVSRYTVAPTGVELGSEYVYKAEMIKFVFDTTWDSWPNEAKIKYTLSDGTESDLLAFTQTDRAETHLSGYIYIQVPTSVTVQFLQYPNGTTWTVICTQSSSYVYEAGATYTVTSINWVSDGANNVKNATFTVAKS